MKKQIRIPSSDIEEAIITQLNEEHATLSPQIDAGDITACSKNVCNPQQKSR